MSVALDVVAMLALFAAGVAVEQYTPVESVRRSIHSTPLTILGGLALGGPWLFYFGGFVPSVGVSPLVVTLASTFVLWFAIPVAAAPFVETSAATHC